jgi:hypothetical protein
MNMHAGTSKFVEVTLTFERREDGGLFVYSDDVPGFVLSHQNARAVLADIKPALETILAAMLKSEVQVGRLRHIHDDLQEGEFLDRLPIAQHDKRRYVAQFFS